MTLKAIYCQSYYVSLIQEFQNTDTSRLVLT